MGMKEWLVGGMTTKSRSGSGPYPESIQAWLPVKNIVNGVVVTKDNRLIKILEVLPVNIRLLSPEEQSAIIETYAAYLKIAPDCLSVEVRTQTADTGAYVERMRKYAEAETNENCREMIEDNIREIGEGIARDALWHRFFLIFEYEPQMKAKQNTVQAMVERLNEEADTARRYLDACELEVLEPRFSDNFLLKLLYEIINKRTSRRVKLPEGVFDMTTAIHGVYEE